MQELQKKFTKIKKNKIIGDINFKNVINKVKAITPVPGGVGPMTVSYLLSNTLKIFKQNILLK